jgi:uncharacterized protein YecE (DUF72 family)
MRVHVGTSGWSYDHWHGVLYPYGIPPRERLAHYLARFQTAELNASYYRWPRESAFRSWRDRLPEGFLLSVKAPGLLTHVQKLYGPERWMERIGRDLARLGSRRGPLLVQLSPRLGYDYARLAYFLARVPAGLRVAVEFRHPDWQRLAEGCRRRGAGRSDLVAARRESAASSNEALRPRQLPALFAAARRRGRRNPSPTNPISVESR